MASIAYITRDIERALGKNPEANYIIITNKGPYSLEIQKAFPDFVFLIDSPEILDTHELLEHAEARKIINETKSKVLVFKNTPKIEEICLRENWTLLNPKAELAEKIESKASQIEWLNDLTSLLPKHFLIPTKETSWKQFDEKPFILQWSHGHTGDSTILIQNERDLEITKQKFPERIARITQFIKGPMFTVNIVVTDTVILLGNISYQITGILPFTENAFSTIGNDWSLPHTILSEEHIAEFQKIAEKVAQKMQKDGWRGLCGIDVIYDEERDSLHLIEINARQPASTTFESQLQRNMNSQGVQGMTTFEAHLATLSHTPVTDSLIPINDGSQILQRVTSKIQNVDSEKLISEEYIVIPYINTKMNTDLFRIQSLQGIMEAHNKFNKRGKEIVEAIS